jgi:hypothetical protein
MKRIILSVFLMCSVQTFAQTVKIIDIIDEGEDFLVLASDGLVYELTNRDSEIINEAYNALKTKRVVELAKPVLSLNKYLNTRQKIVGFKNFSEQLTENKSKISSFKTSDLLNTEVPTPLDNFQVSGVSTLEESLSLFKTMRKDTRKRSQCYNRAHVWSFEMNKKLIENKRINLGKVWIFFSRKYIKEYDYKWWFHVAPYIENTNSNDIFVMDRKFTRKPLALRGWTDTFMQNNAKCSGVKYYSEYRSRMFSEECFIIKSSMYYWQPNEIKALENGGAEKNEFEMAELKTAYKNGVKRGRRIEIEL